ncbi:hypothetical protein K2173_023947 [Erythroxylum novogranatense]|uniref:Epidermal patterning factor-like protein n=1 Tax=Erythroxylum novogranatense TaxID=1862640 RepID=A0AAV8TPQ6_9ROSI|nr:hypothetical protein K2173_023947 [Erythroxylum novogranatense]
MEYKKKAIPMLIAILLTIPLNVCAANSLRFLAPSPSPIPVMGEEPVGREIGSSAATCHSKCNHCSPCLLVEVSVREMELTENYYPQVWKCTCKGSIFSP